MCDPGSLSTATGNEMTYHPYGDPPPGTGIFREMFLIIHHPIDNTFLLHTNSQQGQLPRTLQEESLGLFFFEHTSQWIPIVKKQLSFEFDLTLLRCVWFKDYGTINDMKTSDKQVQAVVVMEAQGDIRSLPNDMEWMAASSMRFPHVFLEDSGGFVSQFLAECETGSEPARRSLFIRRGWYKSAVEWARLQLTKNGYGDVDYVVQERCTWRGCVLKFVMEDAVDVYLKCTPFSINEVWRYEVLQKLIPKYIVEPLAIDESQCVVLMKDVGPILHAWGLHGEDAGVWMKELHDIQESTVGATDLLEEAGFKRLTMDVMACKLNNIVDYVERTKPVSQAFIDRFRSISDVMRRSCEEIDKLGLPNTFTHGDLYFSNMFVNESGESRFGILDFGESSVSNPLMDLRGMNNFRGFIKLWLQYLEDNSNCQTGLLEDPERCLRLCNDAAMLRDLVLHFLDMDDMESIEQPQLRHEIQEGFLGVLRWYERSANKRSTKR